MNDFIITLINLATAPIRTLAQGAADRIAAVYASFTGALSRVRSGFVAWVAWGRDWVSATANNAWEVAAWFRWLWTVEIPARIAKALRDAQTYAQAAVVTATALLRREASQLAAWVSQRLTDALRRILDLTVWVSGQLAAIVADIRALKAHVFGVLGSPERLAAWAVGAIFTALLGYVMANAVTLAEIAWRHRKAVPSRALDLVDDIADRIL